MNRRKLLTTAAATISLVAGCTSSGGSGSGDGDGQQQQQQDGANQADKTIAMKNTKFQTLKAEVETGATVKWVNKDGFNHDVTSAQFSDGAASWDFTKTLGGGESTTHTFDSEGFYEYKCTIHGKGTMCGVVLVGGVSYDGSLPCQDGGGGTGGY